MDIIAARLKPLHPEDLGFPRTGISFESYCYLDLGKSRIKAKPLFGNSIYTTKNKSGGQLWRNFHVRGLANFGSLQSSVTSTNFEVIFDVLSTSYRSLGYAGWSVRF
jgi:hypothetical protein